MIFHSKLLVYQRVDFIDNCSGLDRFFPGGWWWFSGVDTTFSQLMKFNHLSNAYVRDVIWHTMINGLIQGTCYSQKTDFYHCFWDFLEPSLWINKHMATVASQDDQVYDHIASTYRRLWSRCNPNVCFRIWIRSRQKLTNPMIPITIIFLKNMICGE